MQLEFHQLDLRWEHLRVREPHRQRHLLASLAESGQQTPIVVVVSKDDNDRYLVIDGYKRIAALRQLGRDTVKATVWPMGEAEALLLSRAQRMSPQESALEQGWLLSEMEHRFSYSLDELARRFDRSMSWVSRRLALVELLPEAVQRHVREGSITTQIAMKYLVPVARVSADDCERMAAAFVKYHCDARQAAQLYTAWREGSRVVRERILAEPELFLKTQRQPSVMKPAAFEQVERDLEMALAILHRANRRLAEVLPEMNVAKQEQAQRTIESARRELNRMAERTNRPGTCGDPRSDCNLQSFSLHLTDSNSSDQAQLLLADQTGNLFTVSAVTVSAVSPPVPGAGIRIIKTDPSGSVIANFVFGSPGFDTPNAATIDPQGNIVVVGRTVSTPARRPGVRRSASPRTRDLSAGRMVGGGRQAHAHGFHSHSLQTTPAEPIQD